MKQLVLSGIDLQEDQNHDLVYLGIWSATNYKNKNLEFQFIKGLIKEPWDDRKKLFKDHQTLIDLHDKVLKKISSRLNDLHHVNYSERYWKTLLNPWLTSYLTVIFDRWERISLAFNIENFYIVRNLSAKFEIQRPFYAGHEYYSLIQSDIWNHLIFTDIIKYRYSNRVTFLELSEEALVKNNKITNGIKEKSPLKSIGILVKKIATVLGSTYTSIKLLLGYVPKVHLELSNTNNWVKLKLSVALRQDPFFKIKISENISFKKKENQELKKNLFKMGLDENDLEGYLNINLARDLPDEFLSGFSFLHDYAKDLPVPRLIVSDNRHWYDSQFKHWVAISHERGSKIFCCQHGGSLTQGSLFAMNFEESISDSFAIWSLPCHAKHRQLPPLKYVNKAKVKINRSGRLSIIGYDAPRYIFRCQVNANSGQAFIHFSQVVQLYQALNYKPKCSFYIRPYPNLGWNLPKIFCDYVGEERVDLSNSYENFLTKSRLVVCTYPETTFSDCVAKNIPVILMYPNKFWELESKMNSLLEILVNAKIVFHNPVDAAKHINQIWSDPSSWWKSKPVCHAINTYKSMALNLDKNWLKEWTAYLNSA
jgi:putative transferase (TIGR04331 family)